MKNQSKPIFIRGFLLFGFLSSLSISVMADKHEGHGPSSSEEKDKSEFKYKQGEAKGPEHWGDIKEEWAACKKGVMQSPIDLSNERVKILPNSGEFNLSYNPSDAIIVNRGHDIMLKWTGEAGKININGTDYFLKQGHWHSPSEHTIDGRSYALELHMVHESKDNRSAVVGLLYDIGPPNNFLSKLMSNVSSLTDKIHAESNMGVIDPNEIKMCGNTYYRYMGSLTVPPCTEGVIWTINKKIETVSSEQVHSLQLAVDDDSEQNARPVQPLHDREVHLIGTNN